jgi:hypothetical protein
MATTTGPRLVPGRKVGAFVIFLVTGVVATALVNILPVFGIDGLQEGKSPTEVVLNSTTLWFAAISVTLAMVSALLTFVYRDDYGVRFTAGINFVAAEFALFGGILLVDPIRNFLNFLN